MKQIASKPIFRFYLAAARKIFSALILTCLSSTTLSSLTLLHLTLLTAFTTSCTIQTNSSRGNSEAPPPGETIPGQAVVTSVSIANHLLTIQGSHLDTVTQISMEGVSHTFQISSQSESEIQAYVSSALKLVAQTSYNLILSSASAQTIAPITLTLDTLGASEGQVLKFNSAAQAWEPGYLNGLHFIGSWDPITNDNPSIVSGGYGTGGVPQEGDYYIVSASATTASIDSQTDWAIGDWLIYGSDGKWHKLTGENGVKSFKGRTGLVTPQTGDYSISQLSDIDTTGVATNSILKWNGAKWVIGIDNTTGTNGAMAGQTLTLTGGDQALDITGNATISGTINDVSLSPTKAGQWDTAYSERKQWDGGSGELNVSAALTSLGLNTPSSAKTTLGLGATSLLEVGTSSGTVAAGDHTHTGVYATASHTHGSSEITEADPQVNTLTTDKWCKANSSGQIDCTSDAPASGAFTAGSGVAYYTGGNVGIGTTAPEAKLTVDRSSPAQKGIVFKNKFGYFEKRTFNYTGGMQSWTIPSGVTEIKITAYGARGGSSGGVYGLGGMSTAIASVTPGQTIYINVGNKGADDSGGTGGAGGYNGGGAGGSGGTKGAGGGGGMSDVRIGGSTTGDIVLVAGGGGGAGINGFSGGSGGGNVGGDGGGAQKGYGGTQVAGGSGGSCCTGYLGSGDAGGAGSAFMGGNGGSDVNDGSDFGGGGGGGGYYGGGGAGGGERYGGGGGSSYFHSSLTATTTTNGVNNGPGYVVIEMASGTAENFMEWQAVDGTSLISITSGGNFGVGTSSPSEKLHVVGNLRVQGSTDCTLGNGSGGTSCSSDIRLKNNVVEIEEPLLKILSLRGVEFDWNEKSQSPGRHAIGVIAQDVEKTFPTAVTEDSQTGYKKVDYAVLVAPLIQAFKIIEKRFQGLLNVFEDQSRDVTSKVNRLESENAQLKAKTQEIEEENALIKSYLCAKDSKATFCK